MSTSPLRKNVVIVDDESEIMASLSEFLGEEDFNVTAFSNADDAMTHLKSNLVHVVLSDINMPGKSGLDFFREFRETVDTTKSTRFVLMTGYADIISVENAFKLGVDELIAKPFDLETISLVLNYLTNSQKAFGSSKEIYFSVPLEEFILSKTSDYDIFLRLTDKYIKVTKSGQEFTAQRLENFAKKGATHVYLNQADFAKYTDLQFAIANTINARPIDAVKKTKIMNHLIGSVGQSVLAKKIDPRTLAGAMSAFENYTQVALCNAQMSNIMNQLLTVAPSLAERSAMKAMLCSTVAGMWRWSSAKVQSRIILSALMCDIGLKDSPQLAEKKRIDFSAKELATYEQHPFNGFQILNQIPDMPEEILLVALQHHENAAGLGFPQKLPRSKAHAYSKLVHGVGEFLDTLYVQKDPSMVQETLDQLYTVQSKIISEQVLKSLFILFKAKIPKALNDVLLPSETNRVT